MKAYVIMAERGNYSDRTEYPVAWSLDKAKAEAEALRMCQESARQQRRVNECGDRYGEVWDSARKAVGDPMWSAGDDTDYNAVEIDEVTP